MLAEFSSLFFLSFGFIVGWTSCTLWHFYLECREDWRKDNE